MAFFFSPRSHQKKLVALFDVGSASVGGALVGAATGEKPVVFSAVRRDLPFQSSFDIKRFRASLGEALSLVAADLMRQGIPAVPRESGYAFPPRRAFCFLSAPWHAAHLHRITIARDRPFKVTRQLIERALLGESEAADAARTPYGAHSDAEPIERHVVRTLLNKYDVALPVGKEARTVELDVYMSFAPSPFLADMRRRLERTLSLDRVSIHSFLLSFFDVVRSVWHEEEHFVLLDVSGEVTEAALIQSGSIVDTFSFPIGTRTFLRALARAHGVSPAEALSLANVYASGRGARGASGRVAEALEATRREWLAAVHGGLHRATRGILTLQSVFLTADPPFADWLAELLDSEELRRFAPTPATFSVRPLTARTLAPFLEYRGPRTADPFLATEALLVSRVAEEVHGGFGL
ncbi:MAG: hypothetical protein HYS74_01700 [Parcubacteria group bacterium]|nr:hypothetical protein [Parcubacteria group bacterium]